MVVCVYIFIYIYRGGGGIFVFDFPRIGFRDGRIFVISFFLSVKNNIKKQTWRQQVF